jgi:hypothetical protein
MQSNLRILSEKLIAKLYRLFDIFVFDEPLHIILAITIGQGFSTFWNWHIPKSKLYPSAYPKIKIASLCVPPYQKVYPNELLLSFFHNPCELLAYPWLRTAAIGNLYYNQDQCYFDFKIILAQL